MFHIHDVASLVSVLCGLNIALKLWDGLAEDIAVHGKRRAEIEAWIQKTMALAEYNAGNKVYAEKLIRRALARWGHHDDPALQHSAKGTAKAMQTFSLAMAIIGIAVLAFMGLCRPHDICILPLELWTQLHVTVAYIIASTAPYWFGIMVFGARWHWSARRLKKDLLRIT